MPLYSDMIDGFTVDTDLVDTDRVVLQGNKTAALSVLAADSAFSDQYAPLASPTFTGSVIVPAGNADNEAAQISTYDASLGRLVIAGVEMGDTGYRTLAKTDMGNPANLTGTALIRRVGAMVELKVNNTTIGGSWVAGTGADNVWTLPAGFRPAYGKTRQPMARNSSTGSVINLFVVSTYVQYQDNVAAGNIAGEFAVVYFTNDAWPSSLPGTQTTAPPLP
jgi:hypothetical protein